MSVFVSKIEISLAWSHVKSLVELGVEVLGSFFCEEGKAVVEVRS